MNDITAGREPFAPFRFFGELSAIPRGSYNEKAAADYLAAFAQERGLWCHRDEWHNVYIKKPGSPGCENLPAVVLQGHTDMVCEKNRDTVHDFGHDPIDLYIENDILRARGTTLGADNGIGVSYMLAALDDRDAVHPPLECIFTSMEEVGLQGAYHIDPALVSGRRMINMDSCPEGGLLVSAAGGHSVTIRLPVTWCEAGADDAAAAIRVRGLLGGHSGCDIEKERANANKLMGRVLSRLLAAGVPLRVAEISGGMLSNAIPRECDAAVVLPAGLADRLRETVAAVEAEARAEYARSDPDIRFVVEAAEAGQAFDGATTRKLADLMNLLPNGRRTMSIEIPELVTLSLNQGVVTTHEDSVQIEYSLRGAMASSLEQLTSDLLTLATLLGGECEARAAYPTWEYRADSRLREVMLEVFHALRGKDAFVQAVHGGVECGVFAQLIPDMDIIAIGPDVDCVHTPDEWLDLNSFGRTYEYLMAVLAKLAE